MAKILLPFYSCIVISLFIGLTLVNLLGLIAAAVLGYTAVSGIVSPQIHTLAGALAAMSCCAVHCIVFTYFIATSKWVQHAVAVRKLDPNLAESTRSFRAQAFPAALGAIAIVFVTAILGVVSDAYRTSPFAHHILALIAITLNGLAAAIEFSAIRRNGQLINRILLMIGPAETPTDSKN